MPLKKSGTISLILTILLLSLFAGACSHQDQDLQLADLSPDEYTYIERIIILERAKAVALNDRDLGNILLDSLLVAWGDSVESETAAMAPQMPERSKAVHELLERIITAEKDSLMLVPEPRRLTAPMHGYLPEAPQEAAKDTISKAITKTEKANQDEG